MKVILTNEVDNLGLPGDVVDVADGYGRNFLLPRGLAMLATPGAMKQAEALTRSRKAREAKTLDSAQASKAALETRTLRIPVRVDELGGLYGSVTANDVQRVLKERGHDIPRKRIELKGSIKEIGTYEVPVHVHPQVAATLVVDVVDQEGRLSRDAGGGLVDAEAVAATAEQVAEDSDTDAEALKQQALEAAEEYEQQQAELAAAAAEAEAGSAPAGDEEPATG
ncbi:MAG: 50S ribosomal protein L9 [Nitriliruptor sp.]|nr:MAG: 50S ribosomal protein L9 [Nitriliruptor sp.]